MDSYIDLAKGNEVRKMIAGNRDAFGSVRLRECWRTDALGLSLSLTVPFSSDGKCAGNGAGEQGAGEIVLEWSQMASYKRDAQERKSYVQRQPVLSYFYRTWACCLRLASSHSIPSGGTAARGCAHFQFDCRLSGGLDGSRIRLSGILLFAIQSSAV